MVIPQKKSKLPEECMARHPINNLAILIKRGVSGFYPVDGNVDVDAWNARHNISPEQVNAMVAGLMFGWGVPAADPNSWVEGRPDMSDLSTYSKL